MRSVGTEWPESVTTVLLLESLVDVEDQLEVFLESLAAILVPFIDGGLPGFTHPPAADAVEESEVGHIAAVGGRPGTRCQLVRSLIWTIAPVFRF